MSAEQALDELAGRIDERADHYLKVFNGYRWRAAELLRDLAKAAEPR